MAENPHRMANIPPDDRESGPTPDSQSGVKVIGKDASRYPTLRRSPSGQMIAVPAADPTYVLSHEEKLHLYDTDENGKETPLSYAALSKAAEALFQGRRTMPLSEYRKKHADSYQINMETYAGPHNFSDAVMIVDNMLSIESALKEDGRGPKKLLIGGCGQGRLAEVYIAMARRLGIETITFNDILDAHIDLTKQRIKKIAGKDDISKVDGIELEFVSDDILSANLPEGDYDIVDLRWYVTAEFLDTSSPDRMKHSRHMYFRKINELLRDGGFMIDDKMDTDKGPGYYRLLSFKSRDIARSLKILPGMESHLIFNNWEEEQSDGFPYQVRFAPYNGRETEEKTQAGFTVHEQTQVAIPISSPLQADTVVSAIRTMDDPNQLMQYLNTTVHNCVRVPDISDPLQKRRKIIINRKDTGVSG